MKTPLLNSAMDATFSFRYRTSISFLSRALLFALIGSAASVLCYFAVAQAGNRSAQWNVISASGHLIDTGPAEPQFRHDATRPSLSMAARLISTAHWQAQSVKPTMDPAAARHARQTALPSPRSIHNHHLAEQPTVGTTASFSAVALSVAMQPTLGSAGSEFNGVSGELKDSSINGPSTLIFAELRLASRNRVMLTAGGDKAEDRIAAARGAWRQQSVAHALDIDAWSRCAPDIYALIHEQFAAYSDGRVAECVNSSTLPFDVFLTEIARSVSLSEARVEVRVTSRNRPKSGFLLLGKLSCDFSATASEQSAGGSASHSPRLQVFAYSHDWCDGSYSFHFQGLEHLPSDASCELLVRIDFSNFAHFLTPGPNCTRRYPGVVFAIPDSPPYYQCAVTHYYSRFLILDTDLTGPSRTFGGPQGILGELIVGTLANSMSPTPTPLSVSALPEHTAAVLPSDSRSGLSQHKQPASGGSGISTRASPTDDTAFGSGEATDMANLERIDHEDTPVCRGGSSHAGRWLLRPRGIIDPELCRVTASAGNSTPGAAMVPMWTIVENYVWCPFSCRLRALRPVDIEMCFQRKQFRKILFIGDSRTRDLLFDLGWRLLLGRGPQNLACPWPAFRVGDNCTFTVHGATFEQLHLFGLFRQPSDILRDVTQCNYNLNSRIEADYFALRQSLKRHRGLDALRERFLGDGASSYDVVVFSEGLHSLRPMFTDDDFEEFVLTAVRIMLSAAARPRVFVYHTAPAVATGMATYYNGIKENVRLARINRRVVGAIRKLIPDLLVFDMFGLNIGRADFHADYAHFSPKLPGNPIPLIGSESNLVLLNMLCNED